MSNLSSDVTAFINTVEQHRVNALELKCFLAGGAPVDEHERVNWQELRNDLYRTLDAVVAMAPCLARSLEVAGLDSSDVLRVANIVGESFDNTHVLDARLWVNWSEWKVQLERLAIRAETPAEHAPDLAGESSVGPVPATMPCLPERRHSEDFRSVHWHGRDYAFSAGQAAAVSALWAAFENGTPELAQETILSKAGLESKKLRSVFQVGSEVHPAWGVLIAPGSSKGSYCLLAPAD